MRGQGRQALKELLIGCGRRRDKLLSTPDHREWSDLVTLDINPNHEPDILWNLTVHPLPIEDSTYDEIHAYEVLEHLRDQGDWRGFFDDFAEYWRILKPAGHLFASVPKWDSVWAWGDPSHKRVINEGSLQFLSQRQYSKQIGTTPMSDFRWYYKADFSVIFAQTAGESFFFCLEANKPAWAPQRHESRI